MKVASGQLLLVGKVDPPVSGGDLAMTKPRRLPDDGVQRRRTRFSAGSPSGTAWSAFQNGAPRLLISSSNTLTVTDSHSIVRLL